MPTKTAKKHIAARKRTPQRQPVIRQLNARDAAQNDATVPKPPKNGYFVWGRHAAYAALSNSNRRVTNIYAASSEIESHINAYVTNLPANRRNILPKIQLIDPRQIGSIEGSYGKTVHQGIVIAVRPLEPPHLDDFVAAHSKKKLRIVLLDQLSDPRNVGAILRSAQAFGAAAVITTFRNSVEESGTLARAASGALDNIPFLRVTNLAQTIKKLKNNNICVVGLTGDGTMPASNLAKIEQLAIVLGAEGKGLRRLSRDHCDHLARIDIDTCCNSLNVSNAAAIALYAASLS